VLPLAGCLDPSGEGSGAAGLRMSCTCTREIRRALIAG